MLRADNVEDGANGQRLSFVFFFQAEDGIRDVAVTGVQTCALPICCTRPAQRECCPAPSGGDPGCKNFSWRKNCRRQMGARIWSRSDLSPRSAEHSCEIGRASCRERV